MLVVGMPEGGRSADLFQQDLASLEDPQPDNIREALKDVADFHDGGGAGFDVSAGSRTSREMQRLISGFFRGCLVFNVWFHIGVFR